MVLIEVYESCSGVSPTLVFVNTFFLTHEGSCGIDTLIILIKSRMHQLM
jgi:hypothetical protein